MKGIDDLIDEVCRDLRPDQLKDLSEIFSDKEDSWTANREQSRHKAAKDEDLIYRIDCHVTCHLCKAYTKVTILSVAKKPINAVIGTCPVCKPRLISLGAEALAEKLIKVYTLMPPELEYRTYLIRDDEEEQIAREVIFFDI